MCGDMSLVCVLMTGYIKSGCLCLTFSKQTINQFRCIRASPLSNIYFAYADDFTNQLKRVFTSSFGESRRCWGEMLYIAGNVWYLRPRLQLDYRSLKLRSVSPKKEGK